MRREQPAAPGFDALALAPQDDAPTLTLPAGLVAVQALLAADGEAAGAATLAAVTGTERTLTLSFPLPGG